uniref:Uncharacterized protein n=1 Tax=Amazona collaria TaxID=241587 RepID=A0A8B9FLB3_9PSIT
NPSTWLWLIVSAPQSCLHESGELLHSCNTPCQLKETPGITHTSFITRDTFNSKMNLQSWVTQASIVFMSFNVQGGSLSSKLAHGSHFPRPCVINPKAFQSFFDAHSIEQSFLSVIITKYQSILEISKIYFNNCKSLLKNKDMTQYLREGKFEVVLTDPTQLCGPLIAEHLSIPSVYFLRGFPCGMDSDATQCPSPLSYVPRFLLNNSDKMTFTQRVKNVLVRMLEFVYCEPLFARYEELAAEVFLNKMRTVELLSHGSVWLMRYDFVFEFPRPVMPNMVFIGGINCDQKKISLRY